MNKAANPQKN